MARGLSWSLDETKAYLLTTKSESSSSTYEFLTVFSDPYDTKNPYGGDLSPITYKIPIGASGAQPLSNDASMFALAGENGYERVMIVREREIALLSINEAKPSYSQAVYTTENSPNKRTLHVAFNEEANAVYMFDTVNEHILVISKYSLDALAAVGDD